uniref:BHLH domain-containing protein n=1 Tax=Heliothis virescens TaxID=7102 RepID=A0A2A4K5Z1_HELVI
MGNNKKQTSGGESDVPYRRRGRPAGKNRIPLSQEERRARNAQYERERRNETAEVISQLVEAVNCDPKVSNAELLATVISRIQRATRKKSESISDLQRINANLEAQILTLQGQLGLDDASLELLGSDDDDIETPGPHSYPETSAIDNDSENYNLRKQRKKRKRSEWQSSIEDIQQEKRTKTQSETCSVDSGIEMRGQTVSPPTLTLQDNAEYLIQADQIPVETHEEQEYVCETHIELHTELYNQIYNSESQSSSESVPQWDMGTLSAESQSTPCIESIARSLIVVPPIVPPQQPPDSQDYTQPDLTTLENIELQSDFDISNAIIANDCDYQPQDVNQLTIFDFLNDDGRGLLTNFEGPDCFETGAFAETTPDMQARSNVLSGH